MEDLAAMGNQAQRRARTKIISRTGRYQRSAPVKIGETGFEIATDATLRQAVLRQVQSGQPLPAHGLKITRQDFRKKVRFRPCDHLIVFAVDASDSMGGGTEARMKAAKGATLSVLRRAYQNRSRVAFVGFGGDEATVLLPPTASIEHARKCLERLPTGGATPLTDGLFKSWQLIRMERLKNPGIKPILVILSDGEANVPMTSGVDLQRELIQVCGKIRNDKVVAVFVDVVSPYERSEDAQEIAQHLGAHYVRLAELKATAILRAVSPWLVDERKV